MYLWMPMIVLGVVKLFCALIDWRARIGYERARAASVVDVLRTVPAGATIRENRADGTVLCINIPRHQELYSCGVHETTGRKPC
jgi:hypothetical protein